MHTVIRTLNTVNGPSKPRKSIDTGQAHQLCPNAAVLSKQSLSDVALAYWGQKPYWTDGQLASEVKRQRGNAQDSVEDFIVALALHKPATADNTRQAFGSRIETAWTGAGLTRENLLAVRGANRSNEDFFAQYDLMQPPHYAIIKSAMISVQSDDNFTYVTPQIFALYWLRALVQVACGPFLFFSP